MPSRLPAKGDIPQFLDLLLRGPLTPVSRNKRANQDGQPHQRTAHECVYGVSPIRHRNDDKESRSDPQNGRSGLSSAKVSGRPCTCNDQEAKDQRDDHELTALWAKPLRHASAATEPFETLTPTTPP